MSNTSTSIHTYYKNPAEIQLKLQQQSPPSHIYSNKSLRHKHLVRLFFLFIFLTDSQKADVKNRERANPKTLRHLGTGMPFMALHKIRHVKKSPRLFLSMATIFRPTGFHFHRIVWPDERKFPKAWGFADYSSSQWIPNWGTRVVTPILVVKFFHPRGVHCFPILFLPLSSFYQQPLGASDPRV